MVLFIYFGGYSGLVFVLFVFDLFVIFYVVGYVLLKNCIEGGGFDDDVLVSIDGKGVELYNIGFVFFIVFWFGCFVECCIVYVLVSNLDVFIGIDEGV